VVHREVEVVGRERVDSAGGAGVAEDALEVDARVRDERLVPDEVPSPR
jgi:hypothetical protein